MISKVIFNGKDLSEFGVRFSGTETYGAPERKVTYESVPGRNGSLIIDEGVYNNIDLTYSAMIKDDFKQNIRGLRDYLLSVKGYARLEDTYSPETYYMACYSNAVQLSARGKNNRWAEFDITFSRKPQRFLKVGERTAEFTSSGIIYNPTLFDAKPFIRAYGHGDLTVNGTKITIGGTTAYTDIDCDLQDCYYISTNMNNYIIIDGYDFPVLSPGNNAITLGSGITRVIITPRWWHL